MRYRHRTGFSLIELVIVAVIIGIIGAIAVPRLSSAGENARAAALLADTIRIQKAIDIYIEEHAGLSPAQFPSGSVDTRGAVFIQRLTTRTDINGLMSPSEIYGPYIQSMPVNPVNKLKTVRINGAAAGAGTSGWHYNVAANEFLPDDADGVQTMIDAKVRAIGK